MKSYKYKDIYRHYVFMRFCICINTIVHTYRDTYIDTYYSTYIHRYLYPSLRYSIQINEYIHYFLFWDFTSENVSRDNYYSFQSKSEQTAHWFLKHFQRRKQLTTR